MGRTVKTEGVNFIHEKNIIHKNLKTTHVYLTSDKNLKIGGFGVAAGLVMPYGSDSGISVYIAPEILGGDKYSSSADMWSLGIIIYEIITYDEPFYGDNWLQAMSKEKLWQIESFTQRIINFFN